jgi:hypothetical protein
MYVRGKVDVHIGAPVAAQMYIYNLHSHGYLLNIDAGGRPARSSQGTASDSIQPNTYYM